MKLNKEKSAIMSTNKKFSKKKIIRQKSIRNIIRSKLQILRNTHRWTTHLLKAYIKLKRENNKNNLEFLLSLAKTNPNIHNNKNLESIYTSTLSIQLSNTNQLSK